MTQINFYETKIHRLCSWGDVPRSIDKSRQRKRRKKEMQRNKTTHELEATVWFGFVGTDDRDDGKRAEEILLGERKRRYSSSCATPRGRCNGQKILLRRGGSNEISNYVAVNLCAGITLSLSLLLFLSFSLCRATITGCPWQCALRDTSYEPLLSLLLFLVLLSLTSFQHSHAYMWLDYHRTSQSSEDFRRVFNFLQCTYFFSISLSLFYLFYYPSTPLKTNANQKDPLSISRSLR